MRIVIKLIIKVQMYFQKKWLGKLYLYFKKSIKCIITLHKHQYRTVQFILFSLASVDMQVIFNYKKNVIISFNYNNITKNNILNSFLYLYI